VGLTLPARAASASVGTRVSGRFGAGAEEIMTEIIERRLGP
jgi:hypothetical protein